jgi:hypothetical protein
MTQSGSRVSFAHTYGITQITLGSVTVRHTDCFCGLSGESVCRSLNALCVDAFVFYEKSSFMLLMCLYDTLFFITVCVTVLY